MLCFLFINLVAQKYEIWFILCQQVLYNVTKSNRWLYGSCSDIMPFVVSLVYCVICSICCVMPGYLTVHDSLGTVEVMRSEVSWSLARECSGMFLDLDFSAGSIFVLTEITLFQVKCISAFINIWKIFIYIFYYLYIGINYFKAFMFIKIYPCFMGILSSSIQCSGIGACLLVNIALYII